MVGVLEGEGRGEFSVGGHNMGGSGGQLVGSGAGGVEREGGAAGQGAMRGVVPAKRKNGLLGDAGEAEMGRMTLAERQSRAAELRGRLSGGGSGGGGGNGS